METPEQQLMTEVQTELARARMAYLTCPYCPEQAYPQSTPNTRFASGLVLFSCSSQHEFYVEQEVVYGSRIYREPEEASGHCC